MFLIRNAHCLARRRGEEAPSVQMHRTRRRSQTLYLYSAARRTSRDCSACALFSCPPPPSLSRWCFLDATPVQCKLPHLPSPAQDVNAAWQHRSPSCAFAPVMVPSCVRRHSKTVRRARENAPSLPNSFPVCSVGGDLFRFYLLLFLPGGDWRHSR